MAAWVRALVGLMTALLLMAFAPAPALAETALELACTPIPGPAAESDPIVAVHVGVRGPEWRVTHVAASGARYERSSQYSMHDASTANSLSWFGTLIERPYLKMVGRLVRQGNVFSYEEEILDARIGDAPTIVSRAQCAPSGQTVQTPVAPSTPVAAPSRESPPRFGETQSGSFSVAATRRGARWQIIIAGAIPADAGSRLRAAATESGVEKHAADVVLNSSEGSLAGGLSLGRAIRDLRFDTVLETVSDTATCYSACAYAFLGGVSRRVGLGQIGFGQSAPSRGAEADANGPAPTTQQLDAYLAEMGVSHDLPSVAANVGPKQIRVLSREEADELRVNFDDQNSMIRWTLAPWPTGLIMRAESATGAREASLACAAGGNLRLELKWNRKSFQKLPAKGELAAADPKFTINGVDSADVTEAVDDSVSNLVIRFVMPVKDARSLIVRSYGSDDNHFYAGISGGGPHQTSSDLMMALPTDNLRADLDVLIASCR